MAFKTILKTGDEKRELLSFDVRYFEVSNRHFSARSEQQNPADLLDELYQVAKADSHAFRPGRGFRNLPYGGLLELTMLSTADDDWLHEWMMPSKIYDTRIRKGVIEFYDDTDDYIPFKCIEFWDAWVVDMSETMSSTGNQPMTLSMRISPATIRYNKLLVMQQSWWLTDINETESKMEEESEPVISRILWRGYKLGQERKDIMLNHNIDLEVEFSEGAQGNEVELTVKQSKGRRIKGKAKEFTIKGTIGEDMKMIIPDFKVECDFREDNQDFENITFHYKENKVGELKENFGWTYIKENGVTKIFVNVELNVSFVALGCEEREYKQAMQDQLRRTLELSSNGLVTGKIFFIGTSTYELPQVVPIITIDEAPHIPEGHVGGVGSTTWASIRTASETTDNGLLLMDIGETAVHELFHSLRLDHPFERKQTEDSALTKSENNSFDMCPNTDPIIYYNIMNYDTIFIENKSLKELWKYKRPEYITPQQIQFILEEIDGQQKGGGAGKGFNDYYLKSEYWDNFPGVEIN